jgi:mycofactocin precursor
VKWFTGGSVEKEIAMNESQARLENEESVVESLIEEVSIDGMCGVY